MVQGRFKKYFQVNQSKNEKKKSNVYYFFQGDHFAKGHRAARVSKNLGRYAKKMKIPIKDFLEE